MEKEKRKEKGEKDRKIMNMLLVAIMNSRNDLSELAPGIFLFHPPMGNKIIEKLPSLSVFHDQKDLLRSVNHLIQATDMRMV